METAKFLESYKGRVNEVVLRGLSIGGEDTLPLHYFEGNPASPRFALEVFDLPPVDWPPHLYSYFSDVVSDPVAWAKRCVDEYDAELVSLFLASIGKDSFSPTDIAEKVKGVVEGVSTPIIVIGCGDKDKDTEVLVEIAKVCSGMDLLLGPVTKDNHLEIGKACLENGHSLIVQAPLNISIVSELNLKLTQLGLPPNRIVIDLSTSSLGYGIEFSFSTIERAKQGVVIHHQELLEMPIFANVGAESWKTKEAGEDETQGILWEAVTALTLILAGANIVVARHPEAIRLIKNILKGED